MDNKNKLAIMNDYVEAMLKDYPALARILLSDTDVAAVLKKEEVNSISDKKAAVPHPPKKQDHPYENIHRRLNDSKRYRRPKKHESKKVVITFKGDFSITVDKQ